MTGTDDAVRQPHAVTDLASRRLKALKIERLLGLQHFPRPIRLLEIGCGSGGIAHYFATHPSLQCEVTAVDLHDNRQVHDGYNYHNVQGVNLPFADGQFNVVISNHVIEHIGESKAQLEQLLDAAGFSYPNLCVEAMRATFDIERPGHWSTRLLAAIPDDILNPLRPIIPTLIYQLRHPA